MKLELKSLSCGYSKDRNILSNINFEVNTGEICCLLGPNGSGKTTLFKTILKLIKPNEGEVRINGQNIAGWSASKLAKCLAYVSQFHVPPFPYIVKDVVLLGRINSVGYFGKPKKRDYDIINQAIEDMGITHLKEKVYTDISGGERQLVMIAKALAQEPKMLILDEPTASLDYGNMIRVMKKINSLKSKGYGVVMTTHSPDQAFLCESKVALLTRNSPVKFGEAVDIVTAENLNEVYGINVKVVEFVNEKGNRVRLCAPTL